MAWFERTVTPTIPPRTDYTLTPMGESFARTITDLAAWSRAHKPRIAAARERFDQQNPTA